MNTPKIISTETESPLFPGIPVAPDPEEVVIDLTARLAELTARLAEVESEHLTKPAAVAAIVQAVRNCVDRWTPAQAVTVTGVCTPSRNGITTGRGDVYREQVARLHGYSLKPMTPEALHRQNEDPYSSGLIGAGF